MNVGLRTYYAEGSKTVAYEIAEQLGWELPDVVVCPIASGSLFSKVGRGFRDFRDLGLVDGVVPRLIGAQAAGCSPVASAWAEDRAVKPIRPATIVRSLAIGSPADGETALATVRETGGAIYPVPEDEVGENMVLLASTAGVFGETAAGVTLGALRSAVRSGGITPGDTVVLLVTGDGLKTPGPVADRFRPVLVEADSDAFLEQLDLPLLQKV